MLHALGGLELPPELAGRVLDMLVGALPSASAADLPALARALLQSAPRASVSRAVTELRKHVHVEAVQVGSAADTAHEPQLLDALASSVQFRREVASAVLAELGAADALTSLDVWLLCALHSGSSTSSARKLTERTFVRKAADGALSARVARDAVRGHSVALRAHHRALLSFAAAAVRAAQHSLARELGCALYAAAFTELGAAGADGAVSPSGGGGLAFYRQELIGSLLSHGGSGVQSEVDCALSVLWALVEADAAPLKPHSALLSTQLDHLDVLTLAQTRQLFAIFGRLALEADGVSRGRRGDELSILVRKMLTAVDPAFKKRGIAAACAIIEQLCPAQPPNGAGQSATGGAAGSAAGEAISAAAASEAAIEAESLLEQMAITCARDWRCAAFCNAEFSRAVCAGRLHQSLVQKLQAQSHDRLEKAHIVEQSTLDIDNMVAYHGVRSAIVLSLESDETELAVDISYTLIKARNAPAGAGAGAGSGVAGGVGVGSFGGVHLLCSTVELLAECMTRVDGSLSEMDAVLGCPLLLFEAADVLPASTKLRGMSDEARELTCACLFHAANWIRCLLYCFSREVVRANDTSAAANLVSRLESLAAIELVLEQCAGVTPSFVGALAFTHGLAQPAGAGKKAGGASKAAKGKAAKPKKADDEDEDMLDATGTAQDGGAAGPSKPAGGKGGGKGGKKGGGKRSAAGEGDDGKAPAAKKKKAAAAPKAAKPAASGPAAAAKAAASLGLPTGSLHDWPTLPVCAQLSPLFRPISLQTSVLLALVSSKDCNTNDETIEVDPGETVKVSELSPAALHLLVASMHARLAPLLHAAGGGGSLGRVGFGAGGGGAGGALVGAEDSDAAAAAERNLGIDEAFSQVVLGLCSLPQHMSMLLEVIDSTHARAPNAKERAPMDEDEDEDEGGVAPRERDEPPASAKVFERVDERLQPSYALPCVSTTLRLLRAIFACARLRHVDSPSRAHIASLLHAFSAEGAPRPSRHPPDVELAHLAKNAFDYFEALLPSIPCGTTSLDVIELLLAIAQVPANAAAQQRKSLVRRASDAAEVVLGRAWASHMPKPRGSQVGRLFSISLAHAADPKGVLDDWVRLVLPPFLAQVTDQCDGEHSAARPFPCARRGPHSSLPDRRVSRGSPVWRPSFAPPRVRLPCRAGEGYAAQQPLLSTKTIHLFYKPLAEQLVVLLRALDLPSDPAAVKQLDGAEVEAKVASVMEVIGLFSGLLSPSKRLETNGLFIAHILRMRCALSSCGAAHACGMRPLDTGCLHLSKARERAPSTQSAHRRPF